VASDVLSVRALGRATLARQHLLARTEASVLDVVAHLVGLQAQVPLNPYTALWSRVDGFRPEALADRLVARDVVRIVVMRGTIHLVTAEDCLLLRPLMQPVLDAELRRHRDAAPALAGVDLAPVLAYAASALAERPLSGTELRAVLAERFPDRDPVALALACRCRLALVQVPPRGVWGAASQVRLATAESWLGRPPARRPSLDDVVLRYFAAFGPATVADVTAWCRLTGLREVVERLRPRLRAFRGVDGRELLDLPDAPRPDPETPAPVRFLPEYDNLLLSHAERSRVFLERRRPPLGRSWRIGNGSVLHDGLVCGVWRLERPKDGSVTLAVTLAERLARRATASIEAEGRRYVRFAAPEAERRDVVVRVAG
jgi:hypothetical protein